MCVDDENFKPRFNKDNVTIHSKERVYKGFFAIDMYEVSYDTFKGGRTKVLKREIFERDANAVAILPYDKNTDEVVLIEQFRPGALNDSTSPWLIEIVAGMIDEGESEIDACLRELKEEALMQINKDDLHLVNRVYPSPGGTSEQVSVFIASVDCSHIQSYGGLESESEDIRIFKVKADLAFEMVKKMRICNCASIVALNYLQHYKSEFTK